MALRVQATCIETFRRSRAGPSRLEGVMQAGSFDRRCRRITRGIVLLAAAAGIFAAPSAMAQVIDPAPTADAGGPYTVAGGGTVQLSGTFSGAPPIILLWMVSSGSLSDPTIANPVFS